MRDGAITDHHLRARPAGRVLWEVPDTAGAVVGRYASDEKPEPPVEGRNVPDYWLRPPQVLATEPGMHRFVWDLRYPPPVVLDYGYPIAAVVHDTPREPRGPWVVPGQYTVRLTVGGREYTQPLTVRMDPRVTTTPAALAPRKAVSGG